MRYTDKKKHVISILNKISTHEVETEIIIQEQLMKLNTFTLKLIYDKLTYPNIRL